MSSTTPNPGLGLSDWQVAGANNCPSDLKNDGTSTTECSLAAEGQLVLDPRCKSISGVWNPKGALHCCTRQLGRFPDTSHWQVGDLILFGEINPGFRSRSIALAQTRLGYAPKDARWTHAAVYVERDYICHATPFRGVRYEKIYPYIGNHILRVRRDASLSQSERFQIALQAAVRRQRYSLRELAALGRLSFSRSVLARFK